MKLTLYLLFGSAFILVGILALYVAAGSTTFSFLALEQVQFDAALQTWVFLAFYVGFGILAGIWPFHTWSPDGHASAPTAVSMLHAGVLMKLGAYGVVRLGMGLLPEAHARVGVARRRHRLHQHRLRRAQRDGADGSEVRRRVLVGLAHGHRDARDGDADREGLNGAVFQMFAHGIMTGLFFALVGLVYEKAHSRDDLQDGRVRAR